MTMHEVLNDGSHAELEDRLSEYLDDELPADERAALERHLETCASCAATLDELRRVVDTARSLQQAEPDEQVWQGINAQIRAAGTAGQVRPMRRFAFTLPQLAAASVLLALLSGWAALRLVTPAEVASPIATLAVPGVPDDGAIAVSVSDPQYDAAVGDLEQALRLGRERLDPATVETVENDLRIIDGALEEANRALLADPANGYLSGHVIETRQRKLDLLRRATALTTDSQL
jgi:predicted anti-sigma-YlaC factor YlaD